MFKLEIETGNDCFTNKEAEIARILRAVAQAVEAGATMGKTKDINGNTVGKFFVR